MIRAMPMMPMLPAKAVSSVRAFLVIRLFSESDKAVKKLMDVRFPMGAELLLSEASKGSLSPTIKPSFRRMIRFA